MWQEILLSVISIVITSAVSVGCAYAVAWIRSKIKNKELEEFFTDALYIVDSAVKQTTQTFVDTLKKEGKFDEEAQKKAFEMSAKTIESQLSEKMKNHIVSNYGDLQAWIKTQIEAKLYELKKEN